MWMQPPAGCSVGMEKSFVHNHSIEGCSRSCFSHEKGGAKVDYNVSSGAAEANFIQLSSLSIRQLPHV